MCISKHQITVLSSSGHLSRNSSMQEDVLFLPIWVFSSAKWSWSNWCQTPSDLNGLLLADDSMSSECYRYTAAVRADGQSDEKARISTTFRTGFASNFFTYNGYLLCGSHLDCFHTWLLSSLSSFSIRFFDFSSGGIWTSDLLRPLMPPRPGKDGRPAAPSGSQRGWVRSVGLLEFVCAWRFLEECILPEVHHLAGPADVPEGVERLSK